MGTANRREFLGGMGTSVGYAAVGMALAQWLGRAEVPLLTTRECLRLGRLDPLVDLMQETPADELVPLVVEKLRSGTSLADVVGAGASRGEYAPARGSNLTTRDRRRETGVTKELEPRLRTRAFTRTLIRAATDGALALT